MEEEKNDFIEYVKRYANKHCMTPFDACSHLIVKEYAYDKGLTDNDILEIRKDL